MVSTQYPPDRSLVDKRAKEHADISCSARKLRNRLPRCMPKPGLRTYLRLADHGEASRDVGWHHRLSPLRAARRYAQAAWTLGRQAVFGQADFSSPSEWVRPLLVRKEICLPTSVSG